MLYTTIISNHAVHSLQNLKHPNFIVLLLYPCIPDCYHWCWFTIIVKLKTLTGDFSFFESHTACPTTMLHVSKLEAFLTALLLPIKNMMLSREF
ncbi:MAG: hypothetical protein ACI8RD_006739 [Bacillariaceae sp.]|jgi:hypothetical protein